LEKEGQAPIRGSATIRGDCFVIRFMDVPSGGGYSLKIVTGEGDCFGIVGVIVNPHEGQQKKLEAGIYAFGIESPSSGATTGSHMLFTAHGPTNLGNNDHLYSAKLTYNSLGKTFNSSWTSILANQWSASFSMTDPNCTGNQSVTLEIKETSAGTPQTVTFTLTN